MERKLDELLFALMQNMTIAVSGEKLARDLGVSHSTLVRWIEKLREAKVEIRGELFTGYRLTRLPDVLLPQLVKPRLRTNRLGRTLYHFYSVDSTNAFALRLIAHGRTAPDGTLILAESQTAGRGRMGRTWYSEVAAGLYLSLVLRPSISPGFAPLFTLACAVALHNAIEKQTRLDADIKWPNDLLVGGKKVGGILAEIQADLDRIHVLVIGAGLNVNHSALPADLVDRATSLRLVSGHAHSRLEILLEFLEQFEGLIDRFHAGGPDVIVSEWTRHSSFAFGRRVEISDGTRIVEGVTRGVNPFGALRVETQDGHVQELYSGEVRKWE
ncbi:MAG TPA: biotin--[acetyl-CoA-carboxylase] ligase [Terriglobia bacterium]|nr:biotin--[acetyl-CoA-carboxylase] ligase [Terriglobia bacterium]